MNIYNFTGRDIQIYDRDDTIIRRDRLYLRNDFITPRAIIKSNCSLDNVPNVYSFVAPEVVGKHTLPVQQFTSADTIEDFCPDFDFTEDLLVAPNIWLGVVRHHHLVPDYTKLASVYSLVYNNKGQTIGCLGLEYK